MVSDYKATSVPNSLMIKHKNKELIDTGNNSRVTVHIYFIHDHEEFLQSAIAHTKE